MKFGLFSGATAAAPTPPTGSDNGHSASDRRLIATSDDSHAFGEFVDAVRPSPYTDISGGLLQALEFLDEKNPGTKTILIFSDLKEDLPEGYVRDVVARFDDVRVVALNVTKLRSDNMDPRKYLDRLEAWRQRVEDGGGSWQVINDLDHLEKLLNA